MRAWLGGLPVLCEVTRFILLPSLAFVPVMSFSYDLFLIRDLDSVARSVIQRYFSPIGVENINLSANFTVMRANFTRDNKIFTFLALFILFDSRTILCLGDQFWSWLYR